MEEFKDKCSMVCDTIVFSIRAYNAIVVEVHDKDPRETGGVLIGHILQNGAWIVTEVIPPGPKTRHGNSFLEWDDDFINYLVVYKALQYEMPPRVLGLWHRHPGSLDVFSSVDDVTNKSFATFIGDNLGAISGLVNIDPNFRLTMYHVSLPLNYSRILNVYIGDDLIPEKFIRLKYDKTIGSNEGNVESNDDMNSVVEGKDISKEILEDETQKSSIFSVSELK